MIRAGKMAVSSKFEKLGAINLQPCKSAKKQLIYRQDMMNHTKKLLLLSSKWSKFKCIW